MIDTILSQIQTCGNLRAFPLPSTWSGSLLPSLSLPLKQILTLCHSLPSTKQLYNLKGEVEEKKLTHDM